MIWPINRYPNTDFNKINLDWILRELRKKIDSVVSSVNGKTGDVVLNAADVGALPDDYVPPAALVDSVNGKQGTVVLTAADVGALPDTYVPPAALVDSVNGKQGVVVLNAADVGALPDTYTPPSAPVQSVNGQTGAVVLNAQSVGALPDTYTPPSAPVQSVNGQTGAVALTAAGLGAMPITKAPDATSSGTNYDLSSNPVWMIIGGSSAVTELNGLWLAFTGGINVVKWLGGQSNATISINSSGVLSITTSANMQVWLIPLASV